MHVVSAGAEITANGGAVLVEGAGGGTGQIGFNYGVFVSNGGQITNVGTGVGATVTVTGTGGNGTGDSNDGVVDRPGATEFIRRTGIFANGGALLVEGTGGGTGDSGANRGVNVATGAIENEGTGDGATVTVRGTGGNSAGDNNHGVRFDGGLDWGKRWGVAGRGHWRRHGDERWETTASSRFA